MSKISATIGTKDEATYARIETVRYLLVYSLITETSSTLGLLRVSLADSTVLVDVTDELGPLAALSGLLQVM